MKNTAAFSIDNINEFKQKMLNWANRFSIFCLLDNHYYQFENPAFECLLGIGCKRSVIASAGNAFNELKRFSTKTNNWIFGHFGYDLKNEVEKLSSENFDGIGFPDLHFFEPEIVLQLNNTGLVIYTNANAKKVFDEINNYEPEKASDATPVVMQSRLTKEEYISRVEQLREHILRGDCYEINFCQEFYSNGVMISPLTVYHNLSSVSPNPFSALYKLDDKYCICASPERYLQKSGNKIISQPMKGTSSRSLTSVEADLLNKKYLINSEKEKSENVMVVDLVRNDLSKVCEKGSVKVRELFGVYSFPQVHQMISTISGDVDDNIHWVDIIRASFPMGSMTGAPKKRVMQLIEQYEKTKRGLYSGAIGYVKPNKDFDFNVVIRSLLYNSSQQYLSYQVGSAVTFNSNANDEYNECLLKAKALSLVF